MSSPDQNIERYLLGELSNDELQAFEAAIHADPALAEQVSQHREMLQRLDALRLRNNVKAALSQQEAAVAQKKTMPRSSRAWAIAAALMALLAAVWFFRQNQRPAAPEMAKELPQNLDNQLPVNNAPQEETVQNIPENNKPQAVPPTENNREKHRLLALAVSFHQAPGSSSVREAAEPTGADKTPLQNAADAFAKKDFAKAAELLSSDPNVASDELARYLRANARFNIGQFEAAAADFWVLRNSFQFKHDANWNFIMCQLALGKTDAAKSLLDEIAADPDAAFYNKAVNLKKELNF